MSKPWGRFFQILWPSQNIRILNENSVYLSIYIYKPNSFGVHFQIMIYKKKSFELNIWPLNIVNFYIISVLKVFVSKDEHKANKPSLKIRYETKKKSTVWSNFLQGRWNVSPDWIMCQKPHDEDLRGQGRQNRDTQSAPRLTSIFYILLRCT